MTRTWHGTGARARGFTLLEAMVATAVIGVLISTTLGLLLTSRSAVGDVMIETRSTTQLRQLERRLTTELRGAIDIELSGGASSPSGSFTAVAYSPVIGYDLAEQALATGTRCEIRFGYDPGEAGGGAGTDRDDDHDGLTDEGRLVLYRDLDDDGAFDGAHERTTVLAHDVDSASFSLALPSGSSTVTTGDTELVLTLELLTYLPSDGRTTRRHTQIYLAIRN